MQRNQVIQAALDLFDAPSYLEIGVCDGLTFHGVSARRKVAVDPAFRFDTDAARADPANAGAVYHAITSDDYFNGPGTNETFDVIFVDGLHTFDQTLRDLLNATERLRPGGVIVIDDVLPMTYGASIRDEHESMIVRDRVENGEKAWMGDVFRLVFFIRDYMPSWRYATTTGNHGQLVMWRQPRGHDVAPLSVEAVSRRDYGDVVRHPEAYRFAAMPDIVAAIRATRG